MMKYWLIAFFELNGQYIGKYEYLTNDIVQCNQMEDEMVKANLQMTVQTYCVTQDHYDGILIDQDLPLDISEDDIQSDGADGVDGPVGD